MSHRCTDTGTAYPYPRIRHAYPTVSQARIRRIQWTLAKTFKV